MNSKNFLILMSALALNLTIQSAPFIRWFNPSIEALQCQIKHQFKPSNWVQKELNIIASCQSCGCQPQICNSKTTQS